jgi:hypothetical protein
MRNILKYLNQQITNNIKYILLVSPQFTCSIVLNSLCRKLYQGAVCLFKTHEIHKISELTCSIHGSQVI